jgi:isoleucyl-tRNA synthetase
MDNVYVAFSGNDKIAEIALRNKAEICSDTLAVDILVGTEFDGAKSWNVNGETVTVSVKKA